MKAIQHCQDKGGKCTLQTTQTNKTTIVWCDVCDYHTATKILDDGTYLDL